MPALFPDCRRIVALSALLLSVAAPAAPATAQAPCTCRAAGTSFELDACTCLATLNGPRVACCGKVLNNTAWRFTDRRCPLAVAPATGPAPGASARVRPAALPQSRWRVAAVD